MKYLFDTNALIYIHELRLKLPDALIAASVLALDATLVSNDQRLSNIPGLRCQSLELKSE